MLIAYLAPNEYGHVLKKELQLKKVKIIFDSERLFIVETDHKIEIYWAQQSWNDCEIFKFDSISQAQKQIKDLGQNYLWSLFSTQLHRRAALIEERIHKAKKKIWEFDPTKNSNFSEKNKTHASWTLLSSHELLYSLDVDPPFALGELPFHENRIGPPSRAYLKLWDVFTRLNLYPKKDQRCMDLGSSPGGWTWVLAELGASVLSVDKAKLDEKLLSYKNIDFKNCSAFSLNPSEVGQLDWFFSDVICYPHKLLQFIKKFLEQENPPNFICTLKFQGETDFKTIEEFSKILGSRIIHLFHNRHELTWVNINQAKIKNS